MNRLGVGGLRGRSGHQQTNTCQQLERIASQTPLHEVMYIQRSSSVAISDRGHPPDNSHRGFATVFIIFTVFQVNLHREADPVPLCC